MILHERHRTTNHTMTQATQIPSINLLNLFVCIISADQGHVIKNIVYDVFNDTNLVS